MRLSFVCCFKTQSYDSFHHDQWKRGRRRCRSIWFQIMCVLNQKWWWCDQSRTLLYGSKDIWHVRRRVSLYFPYNRWFKHFFTLKFDLIWTWSWTSQIWNTLWRSLSQCDLWRNWNSTLEKYWKNSRGCDNWRSLSHVFKNLEPFTY